MKLKLKKKTRKQLRRAAKEMGRLGAVFGTAMVSGLTASFIERTSGIGDRVSDRASKKSRASDGEERDEATLSEHH